MHEIDSHDCENCGDDTPVEDMGVIPYEMVAEEEDDVDNLWIRAVFCTGCGSIVPVTTTDETVYEQEDEYLDLMVEYVNERVYGNQLSPFINNNSLTRLKSSRRGQYGTRRLH